MVKNVIGQKSQDYTNMSSRRQTQKGATERDLEKHKLREGTSRTEDAEGGRGCGQRQWFGGGGSMAPFSKGEKGSMKAWTVYRISSFIALRQYENRNNI